jgi:hypothetical protein
MATMATVAVKNTSPEANVTIKLPIKIQELIKAVQKGAKRKSPGPDQDPLFSSWSEQKHHTVILILGNIINFTIHSRRPIIDYLYYMGGGPDGNPGHRRRAPLHTANTYRSVTKRHAETGDTC